MEPVFCEYCEGTDLPPSKVFPGTIVSSAVGSQPYYDEQGVYHNHDTEESVQSFRCSNGHAWNRYTYARCPCGYQANVDHVTRIA